MENYFQSQGPSGGYPDVPSSHNSVHSACQSDCHMDLSSFFPNKAIARDQGRRWKQGQWIWLKQHKTEVRHCLPTAQLSRYVSRKALQTLWERALNPKPPWHSGPQKLRSVYLLSKNVCVRLQTCGIRCLGTLVSYKSLLGVLTAGHAPHCILDPSRSAGRRCLTTFMKPCLPFPLPLFLMRTCSGGASGRTAAGAHHAPEDLPEHALCCGWVIQCEMSGQSASLYPTPPWQRTRQTHRSFLKGLLRCMQGQEGFAGSLIWSWV